jgi:hypothetical protein
MEIKKEIWNIWQVITLARECFGYSYYLHKPDTKEEEDYLHFSADFAFIRHIMWRTVIIELAKLFRSPKLKATYIFNLEDFIRKLRKDGEYGSLGIDNSSIDKWEKRLAQDKPVIEKIMVLWEKLYAHNDTSNEKYLKNDLSFEDTEKLIGNIETIVKEIYETVFNSPILMNSLAFNKKRFNLIRILAAGNKRSKG